MTKSVIRIALQSLKATPHECAVHNPRVSYQADLRGTPIRNHQMLNIVLNGLVDAAVGDGQEAGDAHHSHQLAMNVIVAGDDLCFENSITASLNCCQNVLVRRYLHRAWREIEAAASAARAGYRPPLETWDIPPLVALAYGCEPRRRS